MILLDPDLEPHPAPASKRRGSSADSPAHVKQDRLPSVRSLGAFLRAAQTAVRLRGQVSVLLTTDNAIRRLNRQFRKKNKATDVLSFPGGGFVNGKEKIAGDLAISTETARRQADEQGHALEVEIKVLVLHGLLHLAGFDHETDEGEMARREQKLRARLGLPLGLIERSALSAPSPVKKRTGGSGRRKAAASPSVPLRDAKEDRQMGGLQDGKRKRKARSSTRTSSPRPRP